MKEISYNAIIEDVRNDRCSDAEISALIYRFEIAVQSIAPTLARKAWFDATASHVTNEKLAHRFSLTLERDTDTGCANEKWIGTFLYGSKKLKIIGYLEAINRPPHPETIHQD